LYTFLQIIEVNLFEKKPILQVVSNALKHIQGQETSNQLNLFT
ncbi:MAG: IS4 family transposase, partial [Deltaproteobacteria bacterium]|nr:IS4 family transposase [Deltaproteobacteria bacterium]